MSNRRIATWNRCLAMLVAVKSSIGRFVVAALKRFGFRGQGKTDQTEMPQRRELLRAMGILPLVGVFSYPFSKGESKDKVDAVTGPTFVTRSDKLEYARLKALNLDDPGVLARQKTMPVGKIGGLTVGRLISGSNLISMNMHARDLDYVKALAANYNTEERVFMTLKKCEELGINTIVLKNHNFKHFPCVLLLLHQIRPMCYRLGSVITGCQ